MTAAPITNCGEAISQESDVAKVCIGTGGVNLMDPVGGVSAWCECILSFTTKLKKCENEPLLGANIREAANAYEKNCVQHETSDHRWLIPSIISLILFGMLLYVYYMYVMLKRQISAPRFSIEQLMEDPEQNKANPNCFHCRGNVEEKYCSSCGRLLSKWKRRSGVKYEACPGDMNVV